MLVWGEGVKGDDTYGTLNHDVDVLAGEDLGWAWRDANGDGLCENGSTEGEDGCEDDLEFHGEM